MTLDELKEQWSKDCIIDELELGKEAIRCSTLHAFYLRELINAKMLLAKIQLELTQEEVLKGKYFRGELTSAELRERGWEQWQFRTLKSEIPAMVQADNDIQKIVKREQYVKIIVYFLESVLGEIKNRNFAIRAAIDFARMRAGN